MKPSHKAESIKSAPTHYSPSVPMSVYRELAAELRANKAVIDSLNSRNQQLIAQNQRLKQEIHNVVQATLNLGQFAGVARPAEPAELRQEFPSAIAPDTLAKLVRAQGEARKAIPSEPVADTGAFPAEYAPQDDSAQAYAQGYIETPLVPTPPPTAPAPRRKPRPIQKAAAQVKSSAQSSVKSPAKIQDRAPAPRKSAAKVAGKSAAGKPQSKSAGKVVGKASSGKGTAKSPSKSSTSKSPNRVPVTSGSSQRDAITVPPKALPKLFTEQTGEYRHSSLSSDEEKEIGGIWLALSIILIIVTAFGAGFLIMKPLLNDR